MKVLEDFIENVRNRIRRESVLLLLMFVASQYAFDLLFCIILMYLRASICE